MRKPIVAANWKMNRLQGEAVELARAVEGAVRGLDGVEVVLCPPFTALQAVAAAIGDGPLAQVVFSPDSVNDYRSTAKGDKEMGRRTMLGLFESGVFLNPMGTKLYVSIAHDESVCDAFCERLDDTLAQARTG